MNDIYQAYGNCWWHELGLPCIVTGNSMGIGKSGKGFTKIDASSDYEYFGNGKTYYHSMPEPRWLSDE